MALVQTLKTRARELKRETYVLSLAVPDPRPPWYAKAVAGAVVAYALSPIDLIPDFIPVIGYLDDLIVVPLGIALALKLVPANVMADCRSHALKPPPRQCHARLPPPGPGRRQASPEPRRRRRHHRPLARRRHPRLSGP